VSELFEARHPKDAAIIAEFDGIVRLSSGSHKTKNIITVENINDPSIVKEYATPKGRYFAVSDGEEVKKGDLLLDGNPVPNDILRVQGVEELAQYLVSEVQKVYRLQGVPINDKHIEVIVRQMLQKREVDEPNDTNLIKGSIVDRSELEQANREAEEKGLVPATWKNILQGITKASLQTKSFISAASFQETTRVLTEAALSRKVDKLTGLKENVIVGRLIPAGTGSIVNLYRSQIGKEPVKELPDAEEMISVA